MYMRCGVILINWIFTFYLIYNNNNTLLAALSALFAIMPAGMRACVEFHASGGVDFAPNMVTKRFVLAWRQIRVCIIFHPMGDAQTRARAVLCKKA